MRSRRQRPLLTAICNQFVAFVLSTATLSTAAQTPTVSIDNTTVEANTEVPTEGPHTAIPDTQNLFTSGVELSGSPKLVLESVATQQAQLDYVQWDWLQLSSGEWLKGEVKTLYNHDIEFDSDELGLLTFEFADVDYIRSANTLSLRIAGVSEVVTGRIAVDKTHITIASSEETQTFSRDRIITIAPSGEGRLNLWSIRGSLGTYLKQGNTDQFEFNSQLQAKRRTAHSRFLIDYIGTYSTTENINTANNHRISSSYDIYANRKKYYRPALLEIARDPFQNIELKITYSVGLGYFLIDSNKTEWDFSFGGGYQSTQYMEVENDKESIVNSFAFVGTTNFDTELSKALDLLLQYRVQWSKDAAGGYTHHTLSSLDFELTKSFDIGVSLVWDYVEKPSADAAGDEPVQNDFRLSFNLSYEYN